MIGSLIFKEDDRCRRKIFHVIERRGVRRTVVRPRNHLEVRVYVRIPHTLVPRNRLAVLRTRMLIVRK